MHPRLFLLCLALVALVASACTDRVTDDGNTSAPTDEPVTSPAAVSPSPTEGSPTPTACVDMDTDGFCAAVDCNDNNALVFPGGQEVCDNNVDDDCDGEVDCDSAFCVNSQDCPTPMNEVDCRNGLDDDLDGLGDCEDPDCMPFDCLGYCQCEAACVTAEVCDDAQLIDEDCDNLVDCLDPDCCNLPYCDPAGGGCTMSPGGCTPAGLCVGIAEICANGADDDGDGDADCADTDCWNEPACVVGLCDSTNTLVNSGFETGQSPWTGSSSVGAPWRVDNGTALPHAGTYSAILGSDVTEQATLYREFTVPGGASSADVSFWQRVETAESAGAGVIDQGTVMVLAAGGGAVLGTLHSISNEDAGNGWQQVSVDVWPYRNQMIRLQFSMDNTNGSGLTSFHIDDVEMVCSR